MTEPLVSLQMEGRLAWVRLNRPSRHNALTPDVVDSLRRAVESIPPVTAAVVLCGAGRSFSTGGDISEIARRTGPERVEYCDTLVTGLNAAILSLWDLTLPTCAVVQGAVTGGALGLALACDRMEAAEDTFVQPWYGQAGFAPDGGWTAMLPQRVGAGRTADWISLNQRVDAPDLHAVGLVAAVSPDPIAAARVWAARVSEQAAATHHRTRRLIKTAHARNRLHLALEAERRAFLDLLREPSVDRWLDSLLTRLREERKASA
jgi:2-(1,2-epoxy-1,2-dihydrophenyl)acetyl-CoA isomerase